MHGEYKVQGGKLVVVDLELRDSRIADVQIAGDFFLEPAEALDDIRGAVEGLPAASDVEQIVAAIRAALRPDAALIGFSAEAVAIAVRRALGSRGGWRDYDWQIIDTPPLSPAMHLALDEVLAQEVAAGRRGPMLRFWEWERPAIIIGAFQSLRNEVDLDAASALGVEVVRRVTGGTVLHHVTMAYDMDAEKMVKVLRIGREKLSDKGTVSAVKRVDPLRSQTGLRARR